jgi:hypothetical protein
MLGMPYVDGTSELFVHNPGKVECRRGSRTQISRYKNLVGWKSVRCHD